MAIVALAIGWQEGESAQNPGQVVSIPANYGNLGSEARWRDRAKGWRRGWTPYAPDPRLLQYNELSAPAFHRIPTANVGALSTNNANVKAPVVFSPAGQSSSGTKLASSTSAGSTTKSLL